MAVIPTIIAMESHLNSLPYDWIVFTSHPRRPPEDTARRNSREEGWLNLFWSRIIIFQCSPAQWELVVNAVSKRMNSGLYPRELHLLQFNKFGKLNSMHSSSIYCVSPGGGEAEVAKKRNPAAVQLPSTTSSIDSPIGMEMLKVVQINSLALQGTISG